MEVPNVLPVKNVNLRQKIWYDFIPEILIPIRVFLDWWLQDSFWFSWNRHFKVLCIMACIIIAKYLLKMSTDIFRVSLSQSLSSFPLSWLLTGFVARMTRHVPLVEKELLIHLEQLNSTPVFSSSLLCFLSCALSTFVLFICLLFWLLHCLLFSDWWFLIISLVTWNLFPRTVFDVFTI
jgi:hypothetical protein